MTDPSLLYHSTSSTAATRQGGLFFGRLAEQSPLIGYEPKTLIEVSSEHTPINLHLRKSSLDTDLNDLATTVDASEIIDTTGVTQLTSPLFSQEREVNGSQAHSSVERPMRGTDLFASIGKPVRSVEPSSNVERSLSNGKRNRELESVQLSQMVIEKILSEQKSLQENGKSEMLICLFMKLADSLNPRGWNSIKQINCLIKLESWLCEELEMRNKQEDRARDCQDKVKMYEEFAMQKVTELDI